MFEQVLGMAWPLGRLVITSVLSKHTTFLSTIVRYTHKAYNSDSLESETDYSTRTHSTLGSE